MRRGCIYFFYDKDGIVDDYVIYFLKNFKKFCEKIIIVVNGNLTKAGQYALSEIGEVLVRENKGLDAEAYKFALNYHGFDYYKQFDELVLCNFTVFGPIFPLDKMFSDMSQKECDWWGLYKWYTSAFIDYQHIPSFFVVYRKKLLQSADFKAYWDSLSEIKDYADSVKEHEQRQTPYYDNLGYKVSTWIDHNKYKDYWNFHWPLYCADDLLIKEKCPFVKRRTYFVENGYYIYPKQVNNISKFLANETSYDTNLITKNIIRTQAFAKSSIKRRLKKSIYNFLGKVLPNNTKLQNKVRKYNILLKSEY